MPSRRTSGSAPAPRALALACLALALLCAGCGQQDLYSPPGAPVHVLGRLPLPSVNEGVAVLGSHAFVAGGQAGLHVVDLADPSHPVLTATLNTTKYAESIEVIRTFAGHTLIDLALVVEGTEGITSYDVTNPDLPVSFNQGTTAVLDGQVPHPLQGGDRLRVRRAACDFQLVHKPALPKSYTLTTKLKWGQ